MTSLLTAPIAQATFDGDRCIPPAGGWDALHDRQTAEQELVNRAARSCSADLVRRLIVRLADRRHASYPQYAGHWNAWTLGRLRRDVITKGGVRFLAGDIVLVKPADRRLAVSAFPDTTAYSVRGAVDCAVSYDVERI